MVVPTHNTASSHTHTTTPLHPPVIQSTQPLNLLSFSLLIFLPPPLSLPLSQVVYAVQGCTASPQFTIPAIHELRERYTYNIYPCGVQALSEGGGEGVKERPMAPLPSRGGAFALEGGRQKGEAEKEKERKRKEKKKEKEEVKGEGKEVSLQESPVERQVKRLHDHYSQLARQPSRIHCNLHLTPPTARAFCPQQQRDVNPIPYYMAYAADVPMEVIKQSRLLSGFDLLEILQEHRKDQFTLSFAHPSDMHPPSRPGMAPGQHTHNGWVWSRGRHEEAAEQFSRN